MPGKLRKRNETTKRSIRNCSLLLQSGDHVVEAGALLHEVVDLLADGAVGGERRVEVDHDAVQPVLEQADAVRHVVLVAGSRRRTRRCRRTASCLNFCPYLVLVYGPYSKTQFLLRCQRILKNIMMGHPVLQRSRCQISMSCFTFADESVEGGGCNWLLILRSNLRISVSISLMALFSLSMAEMRFSCKNNFEVR